MTTVAQDHILAALKAIWLPGGGDLVSRKMLSEIFIDGGRVAFSITVPAERAGEFEPLRRQAEETVRALPGIERATVTLTAEIKPGAAPAASTSAMKSAPARPPLPHGGKSGIPGVRHIVAVASGKGGVGKSTTAVNLALAMQANGLKVGILDADIYGPSLPRLLGLSGPPQSGERLVMPHEGFGLKAMSMGFMVDETTAMIWRGPMVMSALTQMLRDVAWGPLDVLIVDMPPGTGDAQLTLAQQVPLSGAVIVSTPQDLALIDARRGATMFEKVGVPVLGIIENMSYFLCPDCGSRHDIFGHGGARAEADRIHVPFLGEIPLDIAIRAASDGGHPVLVGEPDGAHALVYRRIAATLWDAVLAKGIETGTAAP